MFESKKKQIILSDYEPKRFALKYNKPQIVLEYMIPSTGKLYHHHIKLYDVKGDTEIQEVMKKIYEKHFQYLDYSKVKPEQILKLVEKLQKNLPKKKAEKKPKETKIEAISEENSNEEGDQLENFDYDNENLNKLSPEELQKHKDKMSTDYNKNFISPDDPNFQYDREEDFDDDNYSAEWDESI